MTPYQLFLILQLAIIKLLKMRELRLGAGDMHKQAEFNPQPSLELFKNGTTSIS
ncbi:MAG: hypothetical protein K0R08_1926 [Solimicrobium sp.]|jgi:hypothetical protein|nr:hypothetical protein [Solimicrobium sp.]